MSLTRSGIFLLLNSIGIGCFATTWLRSALVGSNNESNIKGMITTRSVIECISICSIDRVCESAQYNIHARECILLASATQEPPFVPNNELMHFSLRIGVCPSGYDHLLNVNVCLKLYDGDYLQWPDSRQSCLNDGGDLPVLDTNELFEEFQYYMDNVVHAGDRIALNAKLYDNIALWETTGQPLNASKFCAWNPDLVDNPNDVCIYMTHKSEDWCSSPVDRLDDMLCNDWSQRICMKKL